MDFNEFETSYPNLITAIKSKNLMFICGAGISRADPTHIDTARTLSQRLVNLLGHDPLFQSYFDHSDDSRRSMFYPDTSLPKLEDIAEYFKYVRNDFNRFIDSVRNEPWVIGEENICHEAISEYLIEEFTEGIFTLNVDNHIETVHARISIEEAPRTIFHDNVDFRRGISNNIYKLCGCLLGNPYETIWARSQLENCNWPGGYSFGQRYLRNIGNSKNIALVGVSNLPKYLIETLRELASPRPALPPRTFYVVDILSFSDYVQRAEVRELVQTINLTEAYYIRLSANDFFNFVRQVIFSNCLNDLCMNHRYFDGEDFRGGSRSSYEITKMVYESKKNQLKDDLIQQNGESNTNLEGQKSFVRFHNFIRVVSSFSGGSPYKYISFKDRCDRIASLIRILIMLRFNYEIKLFTEKYKHLTFKKGTQVFDIVFFCGEGKKTLQAIKLEIEKGILSDHERKNIKNVVIFEATSYESDENLSPDISEPDGGNEIGVFRPEYTTMREDKLIGMFVSRNEHDFNSWLDDFGWRSE